MWSASWTYSAFLATHSQKYPLLFQKILDFYSWLFLRNCFLLCLTSITYFLAFQASKWLSACSKAKHETTTTKKYLPFDCFKIKFQSVFFSVWFVYCPKFYWREVASCRICPNKCVWTREISFGLFGENETAQSCPCHSLCPYTVNMAYSIWLELIQQFQYKQANHIEALLFHKIQM